jgi:hypothetical protein
MMTDLDRVACVLFKGKGPGFFSASIAVQVHDDGGVEILGITLPRDLPADEVAALRATAGEGSAP